ncbi:hypothetical protein [Vibrio aestuarianus]|uniref:hypothetical protein n=1 Tax=Vibrio aestuarianus TaxID=28171 RepID=UPI00237D322A|nr:hypothetical protein [Vibrio aestuarianus]MDE1336082.1 hypothetical protein [Vibrio aestuarianus]
MSTIKILVTKLSLLTKQKTTKAININKLKIKHDLYAIFLALPMPTNLWNYRFSSSEEITMSYKKNGTLRKNYHQGFAW